jgi:hypothetical protein
METTNQNAEISLLSQNSNNIASLLEASTVLANLDPVLKLEKGYLELAKEGDTVRCIFYGYSTINLTDNETGEVIEKEAVQFIMNKQIFLNSGVSMVRKFKAANLAIGTPVEVTFTEKVKTPNGNVKDYSITLLG